MHADAPIIYGDFHNADRHGRLRLNTQGSLADISAQNIALSNGIKLIVQNGELSAEGEVMFSEEERIWVAKIDWRRFELSDRK
jgi:hypothetical protein